MITRPYNLFIIYAREDTLYRNELVAHLRSIERAGEVKVWTDQELIPGEIWEPALISKLSNADVIILLISANYFKSTFIHDVELNEALKRNKNGHAKLLPVLVSPCVWDADAILSKMQILPSNAHAVSDTVAWPNRESAWVDVVKGIRNAIQEKKTPDLPVFDFQFDNINLFPKAKEPELFTLDLPIWNPPDLIEEKGKQNFLLDEPFQFTSPFEFPLPLKPEPIRPKYNSNPVRNVPPSNNKLKRDIDMGYIIFSIIALIVVFYEFNDKNHNTKLGHWDMPFGLSVFVLLLGILRFFNRVFK